MALGLLAALSALAGCRRGASAPRPDVVLITLDTLRPDFLGFLGHPRETAPFLARLAQRSVVCAGALSTSSWTAPATASLLSGLYPDRHGLQRGLLAQLRSTAGGAAQLPPDRMRAAAETLAERLAAEGYRTFGLSSNPNVDAILGLDEGFQRFECRWGASAEELAQVLTDWEPELAEGRPSFVYLHFNDVHAPYQPRAPWYVPEPGASPDARQAYASEISYVDRVLAGLFARFGWERDAVVMVVSDHGEEFGEHGGTGHGFSLHAELNRVLLMFRSPHAGFAPARVDAPVSLVDCLPTLLELAGLSSPAGLDGRSLAGLGAPARRADSERALARRTLLAHRVSDRGKRELWAASDGDWKLIAGPGDGPVALYDLRADPGETLVLADPHRAEAEHLGRALQALRLRARSQPPAESGQLALDPRLEAELRRLGYVEGQ